MQFVHGKKDGVDKLVDGFIETLQATEITVPAKSQIKKRILEVAEKKKFGESSNEEKNLHGASRWRVHAEVASKLGIEVFLSSFFFNSSIAPFC